MLYSVTTTYSHHWSWALFPRAWLRAYRPSSINEIGLYCTLANQQSRKILCHQETYISKTAKLFSKTTFYQLVFHNTRMLVMVAGIPSRKEHAESKVRSVLQLPIRICQLALVATRTNQIGRWGTWEWFRLLQMRTTLNMAAHSPTNTVASPSYQNLLSAGRLQKFVPHVSLYRW